eukprot:TRINITY_DN15011_c0_g1_i1.p1 TRINITY_DN15011_c0_g1~~TRINITY_DN15011_c0_g1_i1.p1  ORF type:complete len:728 (-),score=191.10 TRINITY_DN15011_c0_g1_i1:49-2232(-)
MNGKWFKFSLFSAIICVSFASSHSSTLEHTLQFHQNETKFEIKWKILDDKIHFQLETNSNGSFGFLIYGNELKNGADSAIFLPHRVELLDCFLRNVTIECTTDESLGGTNDLVMIPRESNSSSVSFSRKLKTGDKFDLEISNAPLHFHWMVQKSINSSEIYGGKSMVNFLEKEKKEKKWYSPAILLVLMVVPLAVLNALFKWAKYLKRKLKNKKRGQWFQDHFDYKQYAISKEHLNQHPDEREQLLPPSNQPLLTEEEERALKQSLLKRFCSIFGLRVGGTQAAVWTWIIAILYVSANFLTVYLCYPSWSFGKSFGSLAAANASLLGVLATRNSFIGLLFRESYERLILWHRWLGVWTVLIVVFLHPFIFVKGFVQEGDNIPFKLTEDHFMLFGTLGGLCGFFIFLTSLEPIRRKMFEWFYYPHIILFVGFYVFGSLHSKTFFRWTLGAAGIYGTDRLLRWFWGLLPSKIVKISTIGEGEEEMVRVVVKKPLLGKLFGFYKSGGQYIFVNFPGVKFLEWHPYTICSGSYEDTIEIAIKALGDQTKQLVKNVNVGKQPHWARMDGPYGLLPYDWHQHYQVVLVVGGIGVTPAISILKDAFEGPFGKNWRTRRVRFIWTIRRKIQYDWFSQDLESIDQIPSNRNDPIELSRTIYVTGKNELLEGDTTWMKHGRPDWDKEFGDISQRGKGQSTLIFACGPSEMTSKCWDLVQQKRREGMNVSFHREIFDF